MNKLMSDFGWLAAITLLSFGGGIAADQLKQAPLGLAYQRPAERLARSSISRDVRIIHLDELQALLTEDKGLLFDVRPKVFWQLGHIPKAKVLQKTGFDAEYPSIEGELTQAVESGKSIIVYCSGEECPDASIVAKQLAEKGHGNLLVFEQGWEGWQHAGLEIKTEL